MSGMLVEVIVGAAALCCGLVTGLLLGFAVVAMPGIGSLDDAAFLRAFKVMDAVIQDRQPIFMLLWVGSVVATVAALALGLGQVDGGARIALVGAAVLWLGGVQLPTAAINIPLNNQVQALDLEVATQDEVRAARARFEARWNRWNTIRTIVATVASATWMVLLLRY